MCPLARMSFLSFAAVRHFHVYAGPWGDSIVKHVRMTCQDLGNPANWYNVVPQQIAGTVTMDQRFSCGDGYWAAGLYGRTGALVDKLGFACKKIVQLSVADLLAEAIYRIHIYDSVSSLFI